MKEKISKLESPLKINRRHFFSQLSTGIGSLALGSLLIPDLLSGGAPKAMVNQPLGIPHFAPKAKRIIYLFQAGAPSHIETFDPKPTLIKRMGEDLPDSVRNAQRLTGLSSGLGNEKTTISMFGCRMRNYTAKEPITVLNKNAIIQTFGCIDKNEEIFEYLVK